MVQESWSWDHGKVPIQDFLFPFIKHAVPNGQNRAYKRVSRESLCAIVQNQTIEPKRLKKNFIFCVKLSFSHSVERLRLFLSPRCEGKVGELQQKIRNRMSLNWEPFAQKSWVFSPEPPPTRRKQFEREQRDGRVQFQSASGDFVGDHLASKKKKTSAEFVLRLSGKQARLR